MVKYIFENVNPKGHKTGDCTTRALSKTLGITWEDALTEQYGLAIKYKYDTTDKKLIERLLSNHGYIKQKQPRKPNGRKYLVSEIDQLVTPEQMAKGIMVRIANHDTCVKDYYIYDLWDCSNKTIGNYYIYEGETK